MAVTHPTATRNGIADYIVDQLNSGSIEFQTSGDVEVATTVFGATAFGAAASGVATANAITDDSSATGGVTTKAELQTSGSTPIVLCAVGTSGSDINLSSTTVGAGDTVSISSLTYTAPA
ncbi:MAG: hypothetical protein GY942_09065 [Aestuariibacter sp.]|nr:hypothetical protein [Aestuariibacter sp.]